MKRNKSVIDDHSEKEAIRREERIAASLPLTRIIARRLASRLPKSVAVDDLASAGAIGLIKAADRFDPDRGRPFAAYAKHRILGEMLDFLRAEDPLSRTERRARRKFSEAPGSCSFPATVSIETVLNQVSRMRSADSTPPDCLLQASLLKARRSLSAKENRVISLLFYSDWSSLQISRLIGVNESRISQIKSSALSKLRAVLEADQEKAA